MSVYDIYTAVALQPEVICVRDRSDIRKNLNRLLELIDIAPQMQISSKEHYEGNWAPMKLISAPEFCIQGHEGDWPYQHYLDNVLIEIPGPEVDLIAQKCKEYGIFFAGCALERDKWIKDGYFWNTQFIINPKGEIIHKYRKMTVAIHFELAISPHDIRDKYAEAMGGDKLSTWFPVTDTEIGKIGTITCMDGHFPETARALGIQGAEVILHPLFAEPMMSRPNDLWQCLNRVRAWENTAYVIGASWGTLHGKRPKTFAPGRAMIINYNGLVTAYADYPGEGMVSSVINLEELRRRRLDPSRNFLTQLRTDVYRQIYQDEIYAPNQFASQSPRERTERDALSAIRKFVDRDIYKLPEKKPSWY